jgi:hypothetical protein
VRSGPSPAHAIFRLKDVAAGLDERLVPGDDLVRALAELRRMQVLSFRKSRCDVLEVWSLPDEVGTLLLVKSLPLLPGQRAFPFSDPRGDFMDYFVSVLSMAKNVLSQGSELSK